MKLFCFIFIQLVFFNSLFSQQNDSINNTIIDDENVNSRIVRSDDNKEYDMISCIIIIDGKYIEHVEGYVEYYDTNAQEKRQINFIHLVENLVFSKEDMQVLRSLPATSRMEDNIEVHINCLKSHNPDQYYHYWTPFSLWWFLNGHLIFRITNFHKEKGIYFFDYIGDRIVRKQIYKKEYGSRKRFFRKINAHK